MSDIVKRLLDADREFHQAQAAKIKRLEDQCRDIRAATIEECALEAEAISDGYLGKTIAAAIRALKEQS